MGNSESKRLRRAQGATPAESSSSFISEASHQTLPDALPPSLGSKRSLPDSPKALPWGPCESQMWTERGDQLDEFGAMVVGSLHVNKFGCYTQALRANPRSVDAWNRIGLCIPLGQAVDLSQLGFSAPFTNLECFLQAIAIDPMCSFTWFSIGATISTYDEILEMPNGGGSFTAHDCFVEAVRFDDGFAAAWYNVAATMGDAEFTIISRRGELTQQQCLVESLCRDSTSHDASKAWNGLGASLMGLGATATVEVPGLGYFTARDCFTNALGIVPSYAKAWHNLASLLTGDAGEGSFAVIGGQ